MNKKFLKHFCNALLVVSLATTSIHAENNTTNVDASMYKFDEKSSYEVSDSKSSSKIKPLGHLQILGDVQKDDSNNITTDSNVSFSYSIKSNILKRKDTQWHISEDKKKSVDSISLNDKIKNGAVIVQVSPDKVNWTTKTTITDFFNTAYKEDIYTTEDIQLQNGCYYKVYVAYSLTKKGKKSNFLFLDTTKSKTKKYAEVYEFYISNSTRNELNVNTSPRKELGNVVNAGKDTGYSESNAIDKDDPHFGWSLGTFTINGYTRDASDDNKNIFLKNVGDKVTLWFSLKQKIDELNGDSNLVIAEDENGYDKEFQVKQSNFGYGTLIIQYTDYENNKHDPIVYTDFLKANATETADTKVQLFEEGDYKVTLDYEIKNKSKKILDKYTNYKINFSFSIRNGNCMVYPFDLETGNELSDYSIASNGFKLDMAKSRYLTIDVKRTEIKEVNGLLTADDRFNRPAKDNEEYTKNGIYTFTVKNKYSDTEPTTKTIYVGDNKYYKALSKYGITPNQFNEQIQNGCVLENDGTLRNTNLKEVDS